MGFNYDGLAATIPAGKSAAGLEDCLDLLGLTLRYNLRSQSIEYHHESSSGWQPLTDRVAAFIRRVIAERFGVQDRANPDNPKPLKFGREIFHEYLDAIAYESECDPFLQWLEGLPEWDGERRLESWLAQIFTVADHSQDLAGWAGAFPFRGAVWRAFEPGLQARRNTRVYRQAAA